MSYKLNISPEDAFADYLALGHGRSLRQLHQIYVMRTPNAPSLHTLRAWSKKYQWQGRMQQQNHQAQQSFDHQIANDSAQKRLESAAMLRKRAEEMLDTISRKLKHVKLETGQDLRACVEATISLIKAAEMLEASPPDRIEPAQYVAPSDEAEKKATHRRLVEICNQVKARSGTTTASTAPLF